MDGLFLGLTPAAKNIVAGEMNDCVKSADLRRSNRPQRVPGNLVFARCGSSL